MHFWERLGGGNMVKSFCIFVWESIPRGVKIVSGLLFLEWTIFFLTLNGAGRQMMVVAAIGLSPLYIIVVLKSIIDGEER